MSKQKETTQQILFKNPSTNEAILKAYSYLRLSASRKQL